jgi:hypothetical protein
VKELSSRIIRIRNVDPTKVPLHFFELLVTLNSTVPDGRDAGYYSFRHFFEALLSAVPGDVVRVTDPFDLSTHRWCRFADKWCALKGTARHLLGLLQADREHAKLLYKVVTHSFPSFVASHSLTSAEAHGRLHLLPAEKQSAAALDAHGIRP